ncbi:MULTISPECIES: SH3 domain-containing protein [Alphaproteobacteria]|uniref:SH3b domain-containing protein n=2 Tax=Alphaproteobacteria TaxID=28211 RepID=A0A512HJ31_9HYPH|nr:MULTISPECIES: SH3 domain-containing protein [Alphaproteobacteria]GEO85468.1 hypothetical protein RNA01_24000 [Ciceribacter naphthalenivorans]GLR21510.1 hypothetical protein GCM10007920_12960 [Ciceribacter naphthalenivorans]GLT04366.1 hypothetical protein GCM10007926_12960 [Sphingomonas psychrolutea]
MRLVLPVLIALVATLLPATVGAQELQVIPAPDLGGNPSDDAAIWHVYGLMPDDMLNIRSGPGPAFRVIGALQESQPVRNLGCSERDGGFWCRVSTYDQPRISGWVNGRYITDEWVQPGGRLLQDDEERVIPGTAYHATGTIRCQTLGDPRVGACAYGVVRNGPFAEIDLTFPDGYTRSLSYRAGRFSAKDGSEVRSRKQGGVAIVTINGEETFHIPDDVVMGW